MDIYVDIYTYLYLFVCACVHKHKKDLAALAETFLSPHVMYLCFPFPDHVRASSKSVLNSSTSSAPKRVCSELKVAP